MAQNQQAATTPEKPKKPNKPGKFSRWVQQKMNARMNRKVRKGKGTFMGMDVLILHTVGRRSGQERQTPVAWFPDPEADDARLIVASGGEDLHPDWFFNLEAHPDRASIEPPGTEPVAVTPHRLEGPARAPAWQVIATAQPRIAKYQSKSSREYPVIRLAPR